MTETAIVEQGNPARPPLILHPHPLVGANRIVETTVFRAKETLSAYVKRTGLTVPSDVIVWQNGMRVPDALWRYLIPRPDDQIVMRARARGGDAGKVLRSVALIAIMLSAPYMAGYAMTGTWAAATGFTGSLLTGAIMLAGTMIVTPLIPSPERV